jgi:hypothetical protein
MSHLVVASSAFIKLTVAPSIIAAPRATASANLAVGPYPP